MTVATSEYVRDNFASLDMAIAYVAEKDPQSQYRLIFDGDFKKDHAAMLASYRGVRSFSYYLNPAPVQQAVDFSYDYSPYYAYEGAGFLICKQCDLNKYPSFKPLKQFGDYAVLSDADAYPHYFLGNVAGSFKDTPDFIKTVGSTHLGFDRQVYFEDGVHLEGLNSHPISPKNSPPLTPQSFRTENFSDRNWINGIADKWAAAFFIKSSEQAKTDLTVGKKLVFAGGITRTITKVQEKSDTWIIFLDGEPLDGTAVGYPREVIILSNITNTAVQVDQPDSTDHCDLLKQFSSPVRYEFLINCKSKDILVLNEYHDGNWLGYVNGSGVKVLKVNANQNGIVLAAGSQFVAFEYRPAVFFRSLNFSIMGVVLLVAVGFLWHINIKTRESD
jgi:hypothetical protein